MESTTEPSHDVTGEYNCLLFDMLTHGVTLLSISLLGTIGNSLSMLTFWSTRNEIPTSLLLLSLAVADTTVLITHALMICPRAFCEFSGGCQTYMAYVFPWMTAHFWPVASTCHLASTWLVLLVTFNRFIGVCHPHKFKTWMSIRRMKIQIAAIGVTSLVYNIPRFCDDDVRLSKDGDRFDMYRTALGSSELYKYVYNIGLYYIVIYVIPFASLIFMSVCLCQTIRLTKAKRAQMSKTNREENDLTLSLVIVVIVYMTCQLLNPIRRVLFVVIPSTNKPCGNLIIFATTLGIVFNSAVNFVIYCIFSPRFRRQLLKKLHSFNRVDAATDMSAITNSTST
ncbi:hypothetical protein CAPTEDRAFT_111217 [Capitella teleta]|uniref:G-protein coupled receptors family 1 profile domain-containing protein n=1 Tax=Capitella teleta TaxID=283909 RepID=R7TJX1_CAPTE|nr:hypothetical protein CAPTEDRAFT_111217 [Capitella teleta]|eukprot:ELT94019.1 hypothetical protein CAPTEDRAFT_111217 [Capitella teleta]